MNSAGACSPSSGDYLEERGTSGGTSIVNRISGMMAVERGLLPSHDENHICGRVNISTSSFFMHYNAYRD